MSYTHFQSETILLFKFVIKYIKQPLWFRAACVMYAPLCEIYSRSDVPLSGLDVYPCGSPYHAMSMISDRSQLYHIRLIATVTIVGIYYNQPAVVQRGGISSNHSPTRRKKPMPSNFMLNHTLFYGKQLSISHAVTLVCHRYGSKSFTA